MKYIIFGAGDTGKELLNHLGKQVSFFCDNDLKKVGLFICGIEVITYQKLLDIHEDYVIFIAMNGLYQLQARYQLENDGIFNYVLYESDKKKEGKSIRIKTSGSIDEEVKQELVDRTYRIDPLKDFNSFKDLVRECKRTSIGKPIGSSSESVYYGYGKALMDYAGIKEDYDRFPIVSHNAGIIYSNTPMPLCGCTTATTVFGTQYKEMHNRKFPYVPIFAVGPYIQYVRPIYSENTLFGEKSKYKRTALVFIAHSIEECDIKYDDNIIIKQLLEHEAKEYDTIMACAYWNDVDKSIYDVLQKNNVKVVSAGFRWDTMFIRRLRTLFELADDIIFFGCTTAVIFALSMKKSIKYYDIDLTSEQIEYYKFDIRYQFDFEKKEANFSKGTNALNLGDIDTLNKRYGLNIMMKPQEIALIYDVCCDIWENCDYNVRYYPIGVYRTYLQYQKEYEFEKLVCLSQAIGQGTVSFCQGAICF